MKNFKNKTIVITGAGSGIGRELAKQFAKEGARLALNDYNKTTLQETADLLQLSDENILVSDFDVASLTDMQAFSKAVIEKFSKVNIVINNAGLGSGPYHVGEGQIETFRRVMDINFYGVLYGCEVFMPSLLAAEEAALVNVSSVFGLTGVANKSPYVASKFAVNGFTQCLIQEFYDNKNFSIHCVHPAGIKTNIVKNSIDYQSGASTMEQNLTVTATNAARTIIDGIKRKKPRILIGRSAYLLDKVTRIHPTLGSRMVNQKIKKA